MKVLTILHNKVETQGVWWDLHGQTKTSLYVVCKGREDVSICQGLTSVRENVENGKDVKNSIDYLLSIFEKDLKKGEDRL